MFLLRMCGYITAKGASSRASMGKNNAFTLIELSIVLVIIGLIVSGLLAGKELIRAAEIRATIKQLEQFDTAYGAFKSKYNCLPGDCAKADDFGFTDYRNRTTGWNNGNGDGILSFTIISPNLIYEFYNAWQHLSQAQLVANVVDINAATQYKGVYTALPTHSAASGNRGSWLAMYIGVGTNPSYPVMTPPGHYYWAQSTFSGGGVAGVLLPIDAFSIDSKLDDGLPRTGRIRASGNALTTADDHNDAVPIFNPASDVGTSSADNYCIIGSAPGYLYNVGNTSGAENDPGVSGSLCTLAAKTSGF
jgi:prepilin-type N-terminal cleavage/methylation domain-containing protein